MFQYCFDRVFKARGIDKPFSFLKKIGFSDSFASKIKNDKVSRLDLRHMESICFHLECTPNDFIIWNPEKDMSFNESHPLNELKNNDYEVDIIKTISSIPIGRLKQIEELIKDELKKE